MPKREIVVKFESLEILEKKVSKFGTGAHVFVSKNLINKKVKIVVGYSKVDKKELKIDFFNSEILERQVTGFGTGAHIILPKENIGKNIKIILESEK